VGSQYVAWGGAAQDSVQSFGEMIDKVTMKKGSILWRFAGMSL